MAGLTLNKAERRELIAALVTNCGPSWDEEDIELLTNVSDEKLVAHAEDCAQRLVANEDIEVEGDLPDSLDASTSEDESEAKDGKTVRGKDQPKKCFDDDGNEVSCPDGDGEQSGAPSAGDKPMTENEWLEIAPPRIRSVVTNAMAFEHAQKQQLVERITANKRNRFSEDYLMDLSVQELEGIVDLMPAPTNNRRQPLYIGASGGPVLNVAQADPDDILVPPTLDFTREHRN